MLNRLAEANNKLKHTLSFYVYVFCMREKRRLSLSTDYLSLFVKNATKSTATSIEIKLEPKVVSHSDLKDEYENYYYYYWIKLYWKVGETQSRLRDRIFPSNAICYWLHQQHYRRLVL